MFNLALGNKTISANRDCYAIVIWAYTIPCPPDLCRGCPLRDWSAKVSKDYAIHVILEGDE